MIHTKLQSLLSDDYTEVSAADIVLMGIEPLPPEMAEDETLLHAPVTDEKDQIDERQNSREETNH